MKAPVELRAKLRRQWENADNRVARLLGAADAWPLHVSIGRPPPNVLSNDLDRVQKHIRAWRDISVGEVVWEPVRYRATSDRVDIPVQWVLHQPTDWVAACGDKKMREEFDLLATFAEQSDACFHSLLIRRRSLWREKSPATVVQATRLALSLEPGIAEGRPLRMLSFDGIDTKFFEKHARLVTALLDARFDGEVSALGLEHFLGGITEGEHWLLLIDLDGELLPFQKQRVRSSELMKVALPGQQLIIVENESCQHQLPCMSDTVAILGAGFDLTWTTADWLRPKRVAYWGDIDTWGLKFLATARQAIPHLDALMMSAEVFGQHASAAVSETVVAGPSAPENLTLSEQTLYLRLLNESRGRLEQEFLSERLIRKTLTEWNCA